MKNITLLKTATSFLFLSIFTLFSCNKEVIEVQPREEPQEENDWTFEFSKQITVQDELGNSVLIEIFSNNETILENHNATDFELVTTTESLPENSVEILESLEEEDKIENNEQPANLLFIDVVEKNLPDDVTGFRVVPKLGQINELENRAFTGTHYAFGSSGVRGVAFQYILEPCSAGNVFVKLSRKKYWFSIWKTMAAATCYNPGDVFNHCNSTAFHKYRFRMNFKGCTANAGFSWTWFWQTGC